jgi:prephenate dehydrogenase
MFNKISIIGCGLIGSSILRAVVEKKLASKISAYDKASKVTDYLKKELFSRNLQQYLRCS